MIVLPVQEIRRRGMSEMKEPWANGPVWAIGSNVPKHVVMFEEADICAVRLHADGGRLSLDLVPQGTVVLFR